MRRATAGERTPVEHPPEDVGDERDGAGRGDGDGHDEDVAVADVGDLVGDDALEFLPVHLVYQPGRDGDDRVLDVSPGREGVG